MRYADLAGQQVSVVGLGTWQFGSRGWGWGRDFGPADANAIVARALALGVNLFDTAEVYAAGESERVLGAALRAAPASGHEPFIATKVWPTRVLARQVRAAAARSLARLGVERVGLYQVHWPNPLAPIGPVMAGMRTLLDEGRIGAVGVSNFSLARLKRAEAALGSPVISNQVSYSLLHRDPERELVSFAQTVGRTVIAYSPLAQGLLSGRYGPDGARPGGYRRANRLFATGNLRRASPVLDALVQVAAAHGATPAQVALAWVLRQPGVIVISGAKSVRHMEENAAAADITLRADEVAGLEEAAAAFRPVLGLRALAARLLNR
ncbi:MAG: aldo/keto reductase [Chloroflexota bacterium]